MTNQQRDSLRKIANATMADPTIGQAIGASWESYKTRLKDTFNPKAWIANTLTGGNYTKDRQLAARQQYYGKAQQQQLANLPPQPQQQAPQAPQAQPQQTQQYV